MKELTARIIELIVSCMANHRDATFLITSKMHDKEIDMVCKMSFQEGRVLEMPISMWSIAISEAYTSGEITVDELKLSVIKKDGVIKTHFTLFDDTSGIVDETVLMTLPATHPN